MDILTHIAKHFWDLLGYFHPVLCMLFMRWALLLYLLLIFSLIVRALRPPAGVPTLVLQLVVTFLSFSIGFTLSLTEISNAHSVGRNILLVLSFLAWIVMPYFVPRIMIRRLGYQRITSFYLYCFETIILLLQLIILIWG